MIDHTRPAHAGRHRSWRGTITSTLSGSSSYTGDTIVKGFDRDKIRRGLAKACWKRPVSEDEIEGVVAALEAELYGNYESEVPCRVIGERLMELLRTLDQVAYVRFASVYREFKDARDFAFELEPILAEETLAGMGGAQPPQSGPAART